MYAILGCHVVPPAKIITGSFKGMLRMYVCKERDFKVEDLRLEQELDSAILQITAGRFSS
eukprot:363290-Chlamydomonas_euryale.AAC.3